MRIFILLCFLCPSLWAQIDAKTDLVGLLGRKPSLTLEFGKRNVGIEFFNGLNLKKMRGATIKDGNGNVLQEIQGTKRFAYNAFIKPNFYLSPSENGMDGFKISPYINFCTQNIKLANPLTNKRIGLGLFSGVKKHLGGNFYIDSEFGAGYYLKNTYKRQSGEIVSLGESIPVVGKFVEKLDKIAVMFRFSVNYRIVNNEE